MKDSLWYNPEYRYSFLHRWSQENQKKSEDELNRMIEEWLSARLEELEQDRSIDTVDYAIYLKQQELGTGSYGKKVQACYLAMPEEKQYTSAWYLRLMEDQGESLMLYGKALTSILEDGVLYRNRQQPGDLMLYMGKNQNLEDYNIVEFVNRLFLPFGCQVRVFWEKPFAVLGDDQGGEISHALLY